MIKALIFDFYGVLVDGYTYQPHAEVFELIRSLKDRYKIALLSNVSNREALDAHFPGGELDQLFDIVVASGDIGVAKPQPRVFWYTMNALDSLPEETLFVDDMPGYVDAAEAIGLQTVLFETPARSLDLITQKLQKD